MVWIEAEIGLEENELQSNYIYKKFEFKMLCLSFSKAMSDKLRLLIFKSFL